MISLIIKLAKPLVQHWSRSNESQVIVIVSNRYRITYSITIIYILLDK